MAHNYDKIRLIGKGSFGQVFLAKKFNSTSTQRYVIKDINLNGLCADKKEATLNEVEILGLCRHRNIVRYRDSYINEDVLSIVMEYMPGGDLHAKVNSQKGVYFEEKVILHWFVQICYALKHIHDMKIMHRDLKSQNILLSSDMKYVKIADFGISRTLDNTESFATTSIGTPYYLSPEQCMQKPYNYKTDIWAMGCVLYELCALKLPFSAGDLKSLILAITESKYPPIYMKYGVLVTDLLDVTLQKNPNQRPTATQLLLVPSLQIYIKNYTNMLKRDDAEHKLNQSTRRSITKSSPKPRSQSLSSGNSQANKPSKSKNNLFRKMIENKYDIRKSVSDGNINKSSTSSASQIPTSCDEDLISDCSLDSVFSEEQVSDKDGKDSYQPFNHGHTYRIISQDRYDIDIEEFMTTMIPRKAQSLSDYRRFYRSEIIRIFGAGRLQRCQEYIIKCTDYKNVPANDKRLLPLVIHLISLYKLH